MNAEQARRLLADIESRKALLRATKDGSKIARLHGELVELRCAAAPELAKAVVRQAEELAERDAEIARLREESGRVYSAALLQGRLEGAEAMLLRTATATTMGSTDPRAVVRELEERDAKGEVER